MKNTFRSEQDFMDHYEYPKISTIVKTTRLQLGAKLQRNVTQEEFGDMLVEGLVNVPLSRTSVSAWETEKYEPDSDLLWTLAVRHYGTQDWRLRFALQCLRAKLPDIFEIGIIQIEIPVAAG